MAPGSEAYARWSHNGAGLHSLLYQQHPNYREIFYNTFCPAALAFWERFPSPTHFRGFGVTRMLSWFRRRRHLQITETRVAEILAAADKSRESSFVEEQRDFLVRDLVRRLGCWMSRLTGW